MEACRFYVLATSDCTRDDLVHLLDWQQPTAGCTVSGLAAPLPAAGQRPALRRGLGGIRRGRTRGIGRSLAQAGFQLLYPLVQGGILHIQDSVLQPERRYLLYSGLQNP
jgi:hypothetical protein